MKDKYIMALDQGTSSSRCIIFDKNGKEISKAFKSFTQIYLDEDYIEQDPMEIWASQMGAAVEAIAKAGLSVKNISAIGIANQRETTIMWNKITGIPIYNAISWQCRRTINYCKNLKQRGLSNKIKERTGLLIDSYFSATKIKWILDNVKGAKELASKGDLLFGTVDTFLIWNLTGRKEHVTDYTNASRTMLFNIHTLKWDEEILKELDIPKSILPLVKESGSNFGVCDNSIFGDSIPITAVLGDQQSALFGQKCFSKGMVKNTYGTGCFLLMNTGEIPVKSNNGLITTIGATYKNKLQYVLEGSVFVGGAVIQWLRDEMGLIISADESEKCANLIESSEGVYFVPAFVGLGAPYWNPNAKGIIVGIKRNTNKNHLIRASLESMAYQTLDVIRAMEEDSGIEIKSFKADGGASKNKFLMQFQSDILNKKVEVSKNLEATARGVFYLAGLTIGYFKSVNDIEEIEKENKFFPSIEDNIRKKLIKGWHLAIDNSMF